jgi:hypothetical protein
MRGDGNEGIQNNIIEVKCGRRRALEDSVKVLREN